MPHAELKYSADLRIDATEFLSFVEKTIQKHDAGSGACKGRAYPAAEFHRTHAILNVSMLPKAHRDAKFVTDLLNDLRAGLKSHLSERAFISLEISFTDDYYLTEEHVPQ